MSLSLSVGVFDFDFDFDLSPFPIKWVPRNNIHKNELIGFD